MGSEFSHWNDIIHQQFIFQLSKFVAEERQKKTIYPTPENVFSWTRACDIKEVSTCNDFVR